MKKNRNILIFILLAIISFSCSKGNQTATGTAPVRIKVPFSLSSVPLLELDAKTIKNRELEINIFTDHALAMAQCINGEIDLLYTGFTQGLSHYHSNGDIHHIATPVWGVSSLITNDPGLTSLTDFRQKTILVPFAKSPLDLQLRTMVKKLGLSGKIQIDYAVIQQAAGILAQGKAEGICVPEPVASKLVLSQHMYRVVTFPGEWARVMETDPRSPQVSLFAKTEFINNNSEFLKALVMMIDSGINQINERKEQMTSGTINYTGNDHLYCELFHCDETVFVEGMKNTLFSLPGSRETADLVTSYTALIPALQSPDSQFFFYY
jgi:ABC-type nitrate/sulfonate/bicarbonate transport system substrate-binding protein